MRDKVVSYIQIVVMILINLFILVFAFNLFFDVDKTIGLAILSGVCTIFGGSLTLIGVYWTLNRQDKNTQINELPKKLMYVEDIIFNIKQQYQLLDKSLSRRDLGGGLVSVNQRLNFTIDIIEEEKLLIKSSQVNLDTYIAIRELYDYLKTFKQPTYSSITTETEMRRQYKNCIERVAEQRELLIDSIRKYEKNY